MIKPPLLRLLATTPLILLGAHLAAADPLTIALRAAAPIVVDGRLDEADWQLAAELGPFVGPTDPETGELHGDPAYHTTARILWDDAALYLAFACTGPAPWNTKVKHDDPLYENDVVECFLDPVGDGLGYAEFEADHRGTTFDSWHSWLPEPVSGVPNWTADVSWDAPGLQAAGDWLEVAGQRTGWTVEMRIPMAQLLALAGQPEPLRAGTTLRLNLVRYQYVADERGPRSHRQLTWSAVPRGRPHLFPQAFRTVQLAERDAP